MSLTPEQDRVITTAVKRLAYDYDDAFDEATINELYRDSYRPLAASATVTAYLRTLVDPPHARKDCRRARSPKASAPNVCLRFCSCVCTTPVAHRWLRRSYGITQDRIAHPHWRKPSGPSDPPRSAALDENWG